MSGENDPPNMDADPIDADFEPARPLNEPVVISKSEKEGPGWAALGVTGVLAAIVGGGIGGVGAGLIGGDSGDVITRAELQASNSSDFEALDALGKELTDLVKGLDDRTRADVQKLRREIAAVGATIETGEGKSGAESGKIAKDLAEIRASQEKIEKELSRFDADLERLDALASEAGEADGQDFDRLAARLESLERVDKVDGANPREVNRGLKSLERRLDELDRELLLREDVAVEFSEQLAETNAAIDAFKVDISERFDAVSGTDTDAFSEDIEAVSEKLSELEDGLVELKDQLSATDQTAEFDEALSSLRKQSRAMQAQLDEQEAADAGFNQSAVLAMINIEGAVSSGKPFQSSYEQLLKAAPDNGSVRDLRSFASRTTPTSAELRIRFVALREDALSAAGTPENNDGGSEKSGGALGWMQNVLGDAVVVRRSAEDNGIAEGLRLKLTSAEDAIADGDVGQAVEIVEGFDPPVRSVYFGWMKLARDRIRLDATLDDVRVELAEEKR